MSSGGQLIRLRDVRKAFAADRADETALNEASLDVDSGEYLCVAGPSGSGKSTLLLIIAFLEEMTSGAYDFRGRETTAMTHEEKRRIRNRDIGIVFQNFNLIASLTVRENVELPLVYRGMRAAERRRQVDQRLEELNLIRYCDRYPEQLSGGEHQRVAVARALVGRPTLILADEPTGNLDQQNGASIMEILARLNSEGTTVVLVTHDTRFANAAKRTLYLRDGRVDPTLG